MVVRFHSSKWVSSHWTESTQKKKHSQNHWQDLNEDVVDGHVREDEGNIGFDHTPLLHCGPLDDDDVAVGMGDRHV